MLYNKGALPGSLAVSGEGGKIITSSFTSVRGTPPVNYSYKSTYNCLYIMGTRFPAGYYIPVTCFGILYVDHSRESSGVGCSWNTAKKDLIDLFEDPAVAYNCFYAKQIVHVFVRGSVTYPLYTERHYVNSSNGYNSIRYGDCLIIHNVTFDYVNPTPINVDNDPSSAYPVLMALYGVVFSNATVNIDLPNETRVTENAQTNGYDATIQCSDGSISNKICLFYGRISFANSTIQINGGKGGDGANGDQTHVDGAAGGHGLNILLGDLTLYASTLTINVPEPGNGGNGYSGPAASADGGNAGSFGAISFLGAGYSVKLYNNSVVNILARTSAHGGDGGYDNEGLRYGGGCGPDWDYSNSFGLTGTCWFYGTNKLYVEIDLEGGGSGKSGLLDNKTLGGNRAINIGPQLRMAKSGMSIYVFETTAEASPAPEIEINCKHLGTAYDGFYYISFASYLGIRTDIPTNVILRTLQGGGFAQEMVEKNYAFADTETFLPLLNVVDSYWCVAANIKIYRGNNVVPVGNVVVGSFDLDSNNPTNGILYFANNKAPRSISIQNMSAITCRRGIHYSEYTGRPPFDSGEKGGSFVGTMLGYVVNGGDGGAGNPDSETPADELRGTGGNATKAFTMLGKSFPAGEPGSGVPDGELAGTEITYVLPATVPVTWFD